MRFSFFPMRLVPDRGLTGSMPLIASNLVSIFRNYAGSAGFGFACSRRLKPATMSKRNRRHSSAPLKNGVLRASFRRSIFGRVRSAENRNTRPAGEALLEGGAECAEECLADFVRRHRAVAAHADPLAVGRIGQQDRPGVFGWRLDFLRFDLFERDVEQDAGLAQVVARHRHHVAGNVAAENRRLLPARIDRFDVGLYRRHSAG